MRVAGVPIVVHVAQRALLAGAREVVVAAVARIARALADSARSRSAHDPRRPRLGRRPARRAGEHPQLERPGVVVNLQGDEPLAPTSGIHLMAANPSPQAAIR
ncbi:MAG: hypothetical protein R3F08_04195 [Dokdonella sp.]